MNVFIFFYIINKRRICIHNNCVIQLFIYLIKLNVSATLIYIPENSHSNKYTIDMHNAAIVTAEITKFILIYVLNY